LHVVSILSFYDALRTAHPDPLATAPRLALSRPQRRQRRLGTGFAVTELRPVTARRTRYPHALANPCHEAGRHPVTLGDPEHGFAPDQLVQRLSSNPLVVPHLDLQPISLHLLPGPLQHARAG